MSTETAEQGIMEVAQDGNRASAAQAVRTRLLKRKRRASRFLRLEYDGETIDTFVLEPTAGDRQVYIEHLQPKKARQTGHNEVEIEGSGSYTAAKLALMIRCLYHAPEGKEGPVGERLLEDSDLDELLQHPTGSWIDKPANLAEELMQGAADAGK